MGKNKVINYDDPNIDHYDDRSYEEIFGIKASTVPLSDAEVERARRIVAERMKEFDKQFFAT
jgi:hypothetical protein